MGISKIRKILFCLIINTFCANAQKVLPFTGIGQNINTSFRGSGYYNIATGVQCDLSNYLKPEVELRYFIGSLEDNTTYSYLTDFRGVL